MLFRRDGFIGVYIVFIFICLDTKSTEKSTGGDSTFSNNSNFNLADPKMVPRTLASFSEKPSLILELNKALLKGPLNQQYCLIQNRTM